MESTGRTQPTESTKQERYGVTETEWSVLGQCILAFFVRLLTMGVDMSLTLLPTPETLCPSVGCPCPSLVQGFLPCLTIFCFVMVDCGLLEACSFLLEETDGVGAGENGSWGQLGGAEGRETVRVWKKHLLCIKKETANKSHKILIKLCASFILHCAFVEVPTLITHSSFWEATQSHTKLTYCDRYDYFTPRMHNCLPHFAKLIINQHGSFQNDLFTPVAIELQSVHSIKVTWSSHSQRREASVRLCEGNWWMPVQTRWEHQHRDNTY